MKKLHIIILCIVVVLAVVLAVLNSQQEEATTQTPPTGSLVGDNCGGQGQPSCSDYCAQNPSAPECREAEQ